MPSRGARIKALIGTHFGPPSRPIRLVKDSSYHRGTAPTRLMRQHPAHHPAYHACRYVFQNFRNGAKSVQRFFPAPSWGIPSLEERLSWTNTKSKDLTARASQEAGFCLPQDSVSAPKDWIFNKSSFNAGQTPLNSSHSTNNPAQPRSVPAN